MPSRHRWKHRYVSLAALFAHLLQICTMVGPTHVEHSRNDAENLEEYVWINARSANHLYRVKHLLECVQSHALWRRRYHDAVCFDKCLTSFRATSWCRIYQHDIGRPVFAIP